MNQSMEKMILKPLSPEKFGMIDRDDRDRAANLVEDYWNGAITNREFEERFPGSSDRGVEAVGDFIWHLYDDFKIHTVYEPDKVDPKLSAIVSNCVKFLRSDEDYTWPHFGMIDGRAAYPRWAVILSLGLLGLANRLKDPSEAKYWEDMRAHGDTDAWPFTKRADMNMRSGRER